MQKLVRRKQKTGAKFRHRQLLITSGPYRDYDVHFEEKGDVLELDFYSVCRVKGFSMDEGDWQRFAEIV